MKLALPFFFFFFFCGSLYVGALLITPFLRLWLVQGEDNDLWIVSEHSEEKKGFYVLRHTKIDEKVTRSRYWVISHLVKLVVSGEVCFDLSPVKCWSEETAVDYDRIWIISPPDTRKRRIWEPKKLTRTDDSWPDGAGLFFTTQGKVLKVKLVCKGAKEIQLIKLLLMLFLD